MAECGVDLVTIGVESLADEVLEGMQKGNTYTDILRSMRLAREQGIKVKANLIFDHPRMQLRHVEETLEKLDEILQYVESLGIHSFGLTPTPRSRSPPRAPTSSCSTARGPPTTTVSITFGSCGPI